MQISHHAGQRMSQRGISRRLVDELNEELRLAKQILDKGGVTVVEDDATVITTYNLRPPLCRPRSGGPSHG